MSRSFYIPYSVCEREYYGPSTDAKNGSGVKHFRRCSGCSAKRAKSVLAAPTAAAVPRGHQRRQVFEITPAEKTSTHRSECL